MKLTWIPASVSTGSYLGPDAVSLTDGNPFYLIDHSGLGVPPVKRIEQVTPLQHGTTDRGYHMDARDIVLMLQIWGEDEADFYEKRAKAVKLFLPTAAEGYLLIIFDDGSQYLINGYIIGGVEFGGNNRAFLTQTIPLVIHCPDPTFWSWQGSIVCDFDIGGSSTDACTIPATIPMAVGSSSINTSQDITYYGTADSYPTIAVTGPIANLYIENTLTGEALDFTGTTIAAGEQVTIDLRRGAKTVTDTTSGANKISYLAKGSDLTTFKIAAQKQNTIQIWGSSVTDATSVRIRITQRFIGI